MRQMQEKMSNFFEMLDVLSNPEKLKQAGTDMREAWEALDKRDQTLGSKETALNVRETVLAARHKALNEAEGVLTALRERHVDEVAKHQLLVASFTSDASVNSIRAKELQDAADLQGRRHMQLKAREEEVVTKETRLSALQTELDAKLAQVNGKLAQIKALAG